MAFDWRGMMASLGTPEQAQQYQQQKEKRLEEAMAITDAGKSADAFYKALGDQGETMFGLPQEEFKNLGAREKAAAMVGMMKGLGAKETISGIQDAMGKRKQEEAMRTDLQGALQPEQPRQPNYMMGDLGLPTAAPQDRNKRLQEIMLSHARSPQDLEGAMNFGKGEQPVMPVPFEFGGKKLLINPKSGAAVADLTPQQMDTQGMLAKAKELGLEPTGISAGEDGAIRFTFGPPKAEGKALTQTEVSSIAALSQAEQDLNRLEEIYSKLGLNFGGPVSGRVKSGIAMGQNANIAAIENAITGATPNLARGVFREVGVLTDADVARYKNLLPGPYDTASVRTKKSEQLRERIKQGKKEMFASLKAAGRDVEGFTPSSETPKHFDTEEAARKSGAKSGDVVILYDPATATYRKARLK